MPDDLEVAAQSGLPQVTSTISNPMTKRPPKYRNTDTPGDTWAGRGRHPSWLKAHLSAGRRLEEFLIREN
jgi:DNA-binding protein H-NS